MDCDTPPVGGNYTEEPLALLDADLGPDIGPNLPTIDQPVPILDPLSALSEEFPSEAENGPGQTDGDWVYQAYDFFAEDPMMSTIPLNSVNQPPVDFNVSDLLYVDCPSVVSLGDGKTDDSPPPTSISLPRPEVVQSTENPPSLNEQSTVIAEQSPVIPEQGRPLIRAEDINLDNVAKTQLDATVVALAVLGDASIAELAEAIVTYKIHSKFAAKSFTLRKGNITGHISHDKVVRSVLIPDKDGNSRTTHKPKPEDARYFILSNDGRPARFQLRSAGTTRARQLLGLVIDSTDYGSFTFNIAFEHILLEHKICTLDDILREFEAGKFSTFHSCWSNRNPLPGQSPGEFDPSAVRRALGRYLKQHAAGESTENGAIFSYHEHYWLSRFGMQPIFDKLAERYSVLLEQGLEFYKPLMEYRVKSRRYEDICHNKLTLNGVYGPRTIGNFDFTLDAPNLLIPPAYERKFFDICESTLPGAGNGGYAYVSLPAGTLILIHDAIPALKNQADYTFLPYGFSMSDSDTNQEWEYNTLLSNGTVSCVAGHFNDSCDGEQHFVIECFPRTESNGTRTVDLFLRARRKIEAGEEVFVDYGAEYWKAATEHGVQQASKSCKKKRSRNSTRRSKVKRGKLSVDSLPLPQIDVLPLFIESV